MDCGDYIKIHRQENLPCTTDVVYRAKLLNVGDACLEINDMTLYVGDIGFDINTDNWLPEKKNFCPGEDIKLKKRAPETDLCDFADREIDVEIVVDGLNADLDLSGSSSITFLAPNSLPPAPVPACSTKPNSITIKLNRETCATSSNSQGVTSARNLKHKEKYPTRDCECQECIDHKYGDITSCATPMVTFSTKFTNGTVIDISEEMIDFGVNFVFRPGEMPDCLQIDIDNAPHGKYTNSRSGKSYRKDLQTTAFDVCSSSGAILNVGDTFGAVEIVSIN